MSGTNKSVKTNRLLKAGSYSIAATAAVVLVLVLINLIVAEIPTKYTKLDTSSVDILSLSDETYDIVDSVDEKVTMYFIAETGNENEVIYEFLKRYAERNSNIKIETVDPTLRPSFVAKYSDEPVSYGSVIIESAKRSYVVDYSDMYLYVTDYGVMTEAQLSEYLLYAAQTGMSFDYSFAFYGEVYVTSAIDYVTTENIPAVYMLANHGESALPNNYLAYLKEENYKTAELKLLSEGKVPDDCSAIIINNPESDITADEADILINYLKNGGNVIMNTMYSRFSSEKMPNLAAVAATMGMESIDGVVIETDKSHYYQMQYVLLPSVGTGGLIDNVSYYVLMSSAHGIKEIGGAQNVKVKPLLKTTDKSYVKTDVEDSKTFEKGEGDVDGPVYVGAVGEYTKGSTTGRLVWYSSPAIADDSMDYYSGYGNSTMLILVLNSLCNKETSVSVIAKEFSDTSMVLTGDQIGLIAAIFIVIIPLVIIASGFVIWRRRRRR